MKLSLRKDLAPLRAQLEARLVLLVTPGPLAQVHALKAQAALDYIRAGDVAPSLMAEATARGVSLLELAASIRGKHDTHHGRLLANEVHRQRLQAAVRAATTQQQLDAIAAELDTLLRGE